MSHMQVYSKFQSNTTNKTAQMIKQDYLELINEVNVHLGQCP